MKLTIKIIAVLILVALASPVFILNGCGKPINGGQCGSCPDSTAPFGSTIEAPTLTAPNATLGSCYPAISFVVLGPDSQPYERCMCGDFYRWRKRHIYSYIQSSRLQRRCRQR